MARGWVYVISNKAMPGLVKVGFSMKDPELRAIELNHTGSPHPYRVEYELLTEGPYEIEQRTHKLLRAKREGKEWFKCSREEAVAAIKGIAGASALSESYKGAEREKAEALHRISIRDAEEKRRRDAASKAAEDQLSKEEAALRIHHQKVLAARFNTAPFWMYWLGCSVACAVGIAIFIPKASEGGVFMLAALFGAIIAAIWQSTAAGKLTGSAGYIALQDEQKIEMATVRVRIMPCPHCKKNLRFDRAAVLASPPYGDWNCPACKGVIFPPT